MLTQDIILSLSVLYSRINIKWRVTCFGYWLPPPAQHSVWQSSKADKKYLWLKVLVYTVFRVTPLLLRDTINNVITYHTSPTRPSPSLLTNSIKGSSLLLFFNWKLIKYWTYMFVGWNYLPFKLQKSGVVLKLYFGKILPQYQRELSILDLNWILLWIMILSSQF